MPFAAGGGPPVGTGGRLPPAEVVPDACGAGGFDGTGLLLAAGITGLPPGIKGGCGVALRLLLTETLGDPPFKEGFTGLGGTGFDGLGGGAALGAFMSSK